MKGIHPFPARMAPEIALGYLDRLPRSSLVVDPMTGSGTVLRAAVLKGHRAIGYDLDPLAVLMASAWTGKASMRSVESIGALILDRSRRKSIRPRELPWLRQDAETRKFIRYWFADRQANDLASLAHSIHYSRRLASDAKARAIISIAFSRLIVTKQRGASLAWDVSHSRPHKVPKKNTFDVFSEMERSLRFVIQLLKTDPITGKAQVRSGDGRSMAGVRAASVDFILTSPPYLNAIDYLRGHRLALVWLGYTIEQIRKIRSESIGVERKLDGSPSAEDAVRIDTVLGGRRGLAKLGSRYGGIIERYARDALAITEEIARVLKPTGKAVLVVGDSFVEGVYVKNSEFYRRAAELHGLKCSGITRRKLPQRSRYLPLPTDRTNSLNKRMKTEVVMEFSRQS